LTFRPPLHVLIVRLLTPMRTLAPRSDYVQPGRYVVLLVGQYAADPTVGVDVFSR
jgi:hypothetical protein